LQFLKGDAESHHLSVEDNVIPGAAQADGESSSLLNQGQGQVMGMIRGYHNKLQNNINIAEPPSWAELMEHLCDFMQRPSILVTMLLLIVLIYLSAQNGAM